MKTQLEKPLQTISLAKKLADSEQGETWRKSNVDYHIDKSSFVNDNNIKFEKLYKKAQGHFNESDYAYLTKPYGVDKKYNLRLRNFDIISPLVQMLIGEKSKRVSKPIVVAINSDIVNVKEQQLKNLVNEQLDQVFINELNEFVETGFISRDISGYEEIHTKVDSLKDDRAITGQQSLNFIYTTKEVKRKLRESFTDFIITGHTVSVKNVRHNDVHYDTYPASNSGHTCSQHTRFIEDGESAFVKKYVTISDIIDEFHDELKDKEVKELRMIETGNQSSSTQPTYATSDSDELIRTLRDDGRLNTLTSVNSSYVAMTGLHEVAYVNWKSKVKIGKVSGMDFFGNYYEAEVDETYKVSPNEEIKWTWVNQVWEGTRIAGQIYKNVKPIHFQRGTFDNPSSCKLLINGITLFGRHYFTKSAVEKVEPHQEMYNATHWHLEKVMNKNKDKLTILPKGLIPDDEDMDMFDMMYFADADGFLFLDEVDQKRLQELNAIKVLDLSLRDYLQYLWQLLEWIRNEAEETLGINRQRKGQTFASDGKGMNEQAIFQSAIISEEVFLEHEEFEEREYQGLLDLSKYAWVDGKKSWFVDSDKRRVLLDVQGREHLETEYSVTVLNGREEQEKLQRIRANTQAFIQNGVKPSVVAKMESIDNIEELIDYLEVTEKQFEENNAQSSQLENERWEKEFDQKERHHNDEVEVDLYKIEIDLAKSMSMGASLDGNQDNDIKRGELDVKYKELDIKKEEITAKVQMNRENNETALKNKTAGEK